MSQETRDEVEARLLDSDVADRATLDLAELLASGKNVDGTDWSPNPDTAPAGDAIAIAPNDTTVIPTTRALYVGSAGDVKVVTEAGTTTTFAAVPAGMILPVRVTKVKATGTTASSIVGLY